MTQPDLLQACTAVAARLTASICTCQDSEAGDSAEGGHLVGRAAAAASGMTAEGSADVMRASAAIDAARNNTDHRLELQLVEVRQIFHKICGRWHVVSIST